MKAQDIINQSKESEAIKYMNQIYKKYSFNRTSSSNKIEGKELGGFRAITPSSKDKGVGSSSFPNTLNYTKLVDARNKLETRKMLKDLGVNIYG